VKTHNKIIIKMKFQQDANRHNQMCSILILIAYNKIKGIIFAYTYFVYNDLNAVVHDKARVLSVYSCSHESRKIMVIGNTRVRNVS